jgi:hypothetical protein
MAPIVWLADAFMLAMISRPATGSLSKTWITPATIGLCTAVAIIGIPFGILGIGTSVGVGNIPIGIGSGALLLLSIGSACVLAVAIAQHSVGGRHGSNRAS